MTNLSLARGSDDVNGAIFLDASESGRPCTLTHGPILPDKLRFVFIDPFVVSPWQTNCYLLSASEPSSGTPQPAVVIDPGVDSRAVVERALRVGNRQLAGVICSHGHIDHVADAAELANDHGVPLWLHPADRPMLTEPALGLGPGGEALIEQLLGTTKLPTPDDLRELGDGQLLEVAGLSFTVTHAPGHTPGCVVLLSEGDDGPVLFSGDVLFAGSIGRVDLPGGSMAQMMVSLQRLRAEVPAQASILPGHGPASTMARELVSNPYLNQEARY